MAYIWPVLLLAAAWGEAEWLNLWASFSGAGAFGHLRRLPGVREHGIQSAGPDGQWGTSLQGLRLKGVRSSETDMFFKRLSCCSQAHLLRS